MSSTIAPRLFAALSSLTISAAVLAFAIAPATQSLTQGGMIA